MQTSQTGINLIKKLEGCKLEAYQCSAGVWTIGYGHTGADVFKGKKITQNDAETLLKTDLKRFETAINNLLICGSGSSPQACVEQDGGLLIPVDLNQNQFDALVSFIYNIGINAFKTSTMLKCLNRGEFYAAAKEFDRWIYAGGKVSEGLKNRRTAEKTLFLT